MHVARGQGKGKSKKGRASKYEDLEKVAPNHDGFAPLGEPLKIYLCCRSKVLSVAFHFSQPFFGHSCPCVV
jgi:hypothetical protein